MLKRNRKQPEGLEPREVLQRKVRWLVQQHGAAHAAKVTNVSEMTVFRFMNGVSVNRSTLYLVSFGVKSIDDPGESFNEDDD